MRNAEDKVKVAHWEQFLLSRAPPLLPGIGLAFWAVTIPAGVVGDRLVAAPDALIAMAAQSGGTAESDGVDYLELGPS